MVKQLCERIDIMNFIEKFAKIKKKFDKINSSKLNEDIAIQVNMVDDDCGGAFYISNINDIFSVEPYDYHDYTAMITAKAADFEKLIGRKLELEKALADGKIAIDGNTAHVTAIVELFPKTEKKAPKKTAVKKEKVPKAEKKTEVKKAEKPAEPKKAENKEKPAEPKTADKPVKTGETKKTAETKKTEKPAKKTK